MAKLKVSSTLNLHSGPKEDMAAFVRAGVSFMKAHGFDAMDFPMKILPAAAEARETVLQAALEASEAEGIRFEVCHLPYSTKIGQSADFDARFCADMYVAIDAAKELGVEYAVLHPNTTSVRRSLFDRRAEFERVMAHLSPFAEYAAKRGVRLAVENMRIVPQPYPMHRFCSDPEELCSVADALGIDVCWDFGHANIGTHMKQSDALAVVGKRLKAVHVNDNLAWGDDHVPPFCGTVDWKDAMQGLSAIGYSGLFNYELAGRHPSASRGAFADYLRTSAEVLMGFM